jgi:hypothetical protein
VRDYDTMRAVLATLAASDTAVGYGAFCPIKDERGIKRKLERLGRDGLIDDDSSTSLCRPRGVSRELECQNKEGPLAATFDKSRLGGVLPFCHVMCQQPIGTQQLDKGQGDETPTQRPQPITERSRHDSIAGDRHLRLHVRRLHTVQHVRRLAA